MTSPAAEDLYARLDVSADADPSDIKTAFFTAVRQYPPEQDPDNFKRIREAYDTLTNSQSREEYDLRNSYGPEMEELESILQDARREEDHEQAIRTLKKLLNLMPSSGTYRNQLGVLFLEVDDADSAIKQLTKACAIDSHNSAYLLNLGIALKEAGSLQEAEDHIKKSIALNPDDFEAHRALANLYFFHLDDKPTAHQVLDEAIMADDELNFQDFFYLHDKLMFCVFDRDDVGIDNQLSRILDVAEKEDDRQFAAFSCWKMAKMLADWGGWPEAEKLAQASVDLVPDDENCQSMLTFTHYYRLLFEEMDKLFETEVPEFLKFAIVTMHALDLNNGDEGVQERFESMKEALPNVMSADPANKDIKKAIRIIQERYPKIWEWRKEFWEAMLQSEGAFYYLLQCVSCDGQSKAQKSDVTVQLSSGVFPKYGGLICPECSSEGPFFVVPSCFSGTSTSTLKERAPSTPPQSQTASSGGNSDCFIATAVYGDVNHWKVEFLRQVRDRSLAQSLIGRKFVQLYYSISPPIARYLISKPAMARIVRRLVIDPLVASLSKSDQRYYTDSHKEFRIELIEKAVFPIV